MNKLINFQLNRTVASLFLVLLTAGMVGCNEQETAAVETFTPMVKIIDVSTLSESSVRKFPAQVEATTDSHLAFRVNGEIQNFAVKAGNRVTKGQILAQLDPRDFIISVNDRTARHALALSQFNRAKELLAKKIASQAKFDEAQANLLVAKSNLTSAKTSLEYATLRAPYDGVIAKVHVEKHQNIRAQQVILNMQNSDSIDVSIYLPERLTALINKDSGYQPDVEFDSFPGERFKLAVKEWDTQADPVTRTFKVVFTLALPEGKNILPGMSGSVYADLAKATTGNFNHIVLPVSAVFSAENLKADAKEQFVWVVNHDMQVSRQAVTVGELTRDGLIIKSGLNGDELIVGAGVHYLKEGTIVRAWTRERGL
ncbi:MAG: efflux RND transporter periplasmic adaptor subunit [Psychrobium sp.]|nr:efflux RND transporter periplasmic adaptor subunit [Psychrobium sp.]